jgi:hypothetical protein
MRPVQLLLLAFTLFALSRVRTYRRRGMRRVYLFAWTVVWVAAAIFVCLPDSTSLIARLLGIGRGADLVTYVGLLAVFYLVWRIHLTLDRLDHEITLIVREMALARLPAAGDAGPVDTGTGQTGSDPMLITASVL